MLQSFHSRINNTSGNLIGITVTVETSPQESAKHRAKRIFPLMIDQLQGRPNILLTKTLLPITRQNQVTRTRLIRLFSTGQRKRITLITAPAGYGKTTLLSQWISTFDPGRQKVVWVTLDEFDNEPSRFWSYIWEGIKGISPSLEHASLGMRKRDVPPVECPLISTLINEIGRIDIYVELILDDYHFINDIRIHEAIEFLLYHLPPNLRVTLASRIEPPLSLARLKAQGDVLDLQINDLQFNLEEANSYLNKEMGLGVPIDEIHHLVDLTWGWITCLQLIAVSAKEKRDIGRIITGIQSGNVFLLDYLFEEVFSRQRMDIQNFLLKTSILDRFNASLCDALCESNDSKKILEEVDRANLFISALDESQEWHRYHPIFSNLLRRELSLRDPQAIPELHRKASIWFEQNGFIDHAINHSLAVGDLDRIERLLQSDFLLIANLLLWGDHALLMAWLKGLPREIIEKKPSILLLCLWRYIYQSQFDDVNSLMVAIQKFLRRKDMDPEDKASLFTQLKIIQSNVYALKGDYTRSIELAEQTIKTVKRDAYFDRSSLLWALAVSHERLGDTKKAYALYSETISCSELAGGTHYSPCCTYELGRIQVIFGKLNRARQLFEKGLDRYGNIDQSNWHPIPVGFLYIGLGRLHIEWNQLELAEHDISQGIALIGNQSPLDWILEAQIVLACYQQAQGEIEDALETLTHASHIANMNVIPREVGTQIDVELFRNSLLLGDMESANEYLRLLEGKVRPADVYYSILLQTLKIRMGLCTRQTSGLLDSIDAQMSRAAASDFACLMLELMLLKAIYWDKAGDRIQAIDQLKKTLAFAQPEGYIYSIVKETEISDLLEGLSQSLDLQNKKVFNEDPFTAYVREIIKVSRKRTKRITLTPVDEIDHKPGLVEALTDREIGIIKLAARGADRHEIAEKLHISSNTLKTHLRHIYDKLDAHNLSEAITLAYHHKLL